MPPKPSPRAASNPIPPARPRLKGDHIERMPVSQSTIDDPLFVAVRPSSEFDVAWAAKGREFELTNKGYRPVRPEELESLDGGQYAPREKDFGAYFWFDEGASIVQQGEHILFKVAKTWRAKWKKAELDRALAQVPKKTDPDAEKANLKQESAITVAQEIGTTE